MWEHLYPKEVRALKAWANNHQAAKRTCDREQAWDRPVGQTRGTGSQGRQFAAQQTEDNRLRTTDRVSGRGTGQGKVPKEGRRGTGYQGPREAAEKLERAVLWGPNCDLTPGRF